MTKPRQTITHVKAELLTRHPENVRTNLGDLTDMARSIKEHGILQPLTVTEHRLGGFLILAGHRRYSAGLMAGLTSFPAIIRHQLDDPAEQVVVMLVENTQRRDLDPIEKAKAFKSLVAKGLSQSEIARRVGCHVSTVNYYVAFLDLDEDAQEDVQAGRLTAGQAREAVVQARQTQRGSSGKPLRGRPHVGYFGTAHRLAGAVAARCDHTGARVGSVGCGPCWEQAIVDDFVATHQAAS